MVHPLLCPSLTSEAGHSAQRVRFLRTHFELKMLVACPFSHLYFTFMVIWLVLNHQLCSILYIIYYTVYCEIDL